MIPPQPTHLGDRSDRVQRGQRGQALAAARPGRARRRHRGLLAVRRQDVDPLQRCPSAFPARDPRYDYYTGNPDLQDTGGAPSTQPGYGPNTRTVMQIKVSSVTPTATFDLARLNAAFTHKADNSGVFESSQHPIVVGQSAYNSAYGKSFSTNGPCAGLCKSSLRSSDFDTLSGTP